MAHALIAPDSFKGTLTAPEVAEALAAGFEESGWSADRCPLGDGGEGTGGVLMSALGGERVPARATDPLGRPLEASWVRLAAQSMAVVEVAEASGLALLRLDELDPVAASSYGTGELIAAAALESDTVLVGVGGSATNDGGRGALDAIADAGGIGRTALVCLCDVATPWEHASRTFGPQKGADARAIAELERRLERLAAELPKDPRGVASSGAAGGLAGGLWAALSARLEPGAAYICDVLGLDDRIARADLVVGGEGRLDGTTLEGKILSQLAARCTSAGKALAAVVGEDASSARVRADLGLRSVVQASDPEAIRLAAAGLARSA